METALAKQRPSELAGFNQPTTQIESTEVGAASAIAREQSETQAAIVVAKQFPRDEAAAYDKLLESCGRPSFADNARYTFPRGGTDISGPSIQLAREAARCWGNIAYGLRVIAEDDETIHIKGYAYDREHNNLVEMEDKFRKLIQRKQGNKTVWLEPDERDLRELMNRRGAICVRNAILQLIPPDVIDDAMRKVVSTIVDGAQGTKDHATAVRRMVVAFRELGVTAKMLQEHVGRGIDTITPQELANLRGAYQSIRDGNSEVEEHFGTKEAPPTDASLEEKLAKPAAAKKSTKQKGGAVKTAPEPVPPADKDKEMDAHLHKVRRQIHDSFVGMAPSKAAPFLKNHDLTGIMDVYQVDDLVRLQKIKAACPGA